MLVRKLVLFLVFSLLVLAFAPSALDIYLRVSPNLHVLIAAGAAVALIVSELSLNDIS